MRSATVTVEQIAYQRNRADALGALLSELKSLPIAAEGARYSIGRVASVPSARSTIAATRASASASFASQCRRRAAPRS